MRKEKEKEGSMKGEWIGILEMGRGKEREEEREREERERRTHRENMMQRVRKSGQKFSLQ